MKRIIPIVAIAVFLLMLIGCTVNENDPSEMEALPAATEAPAPVATETPAATEAPVAPAADEAPAEEAKPSEIALSDLEPQAVYAYFAEISAIPRPSGDTKAISDYLVAFAQAQGLEYYQDEVNNVVIYAPATAGYEDHEPIAVQTHMDMVSVSTDESRAPAAVGVVPLTDGEWVYADGTSLGADNGIGVAITLAILSDATLAHPPIEAIITVDEETGLVGANALDVSVLKSKRMLNFDSETEDVLTASSAAGRRTGVTIPTTFSELNGYKGFEIQLSGLLGGHSGVMIHLGRANANVIMARLLAPALEQTELRIAAWKGGMAHNVIANETRAVIAVPEQDAEQILALLDETGAALIKEYAETDAGMTFAIAETEVAEAISAEESKQIVTMLTSIPDGLIQMSDAQENTPAVSLNSGVTELRDADFFVRTFFRSNISSEVEPLYADFLAEVTANNGTCEIESDYGAWDYATVSPIRAQVLESYRTVLGREARVELTHGGLECGIFAGKIPGIDIIAIGPELPDAHSVDEKVKVQSIADIYAVILDVLAKS